MARQRKTEMQRQAALRQKAWETRPVRRGVNPGQRTQSPREAGRGVSRGVSKVTNRRGRRYSAGGMLTVELLIGAGIVALRMVSDYEPQQDGTLKGKIGHPKGQYGPLPILAGLLVTFFLLSFLAARGGTKGKVAVVAGGLIDLVLAMKSTGEIEKTGKTFSSFGTAKAPAGDWQSTGTIAGQPIVSDSSSSSGSGSDSGGPPPGESEKQWLKTHPGAGVIPPPENM